MENRRGSVHESEGAHEMLRIFVDELRQAFATRLVVPKWRLYVRVVICRKHVSPRTRKNFQLDLLRNFGLGR